MTTATNNEAQFKAISEFSTQVSPANVKAVMKAVGAKSSDLWQVPVEMLREIPNFNMRLDSQAYEEQIEYLTMSIVQNNFYKDKPLTGYVAVDPDDSTKEVVFITDGHTRLKAVARAKERGKVIETLPVTIKDRTSTMADLTISSYHSNNGNKPYTTLEMALLCLRLRQKPIDLEPFQIGERLNITTAYVETLLTLARADKEIRDLVQSGKVSASTAIATIRAKKENAAPVLKRAVQEKEAKEAVKGTTTKTTTVKMNDISPERKLLAEQHRLAPRLFAEVARMEKSGELKITAELERILFAVENVNGPKEQA